MNPRVRKWLLRLHLFAGLTVGGLLALIGVTGSLLVFDTELDAKLNHQLLQVAAPANGSYASLQAITERVARDFPQKQIARVRLPRGGSDACEICFKPPADKPATCVYVNPYTTEITGTRIPDESLKQTIFMLHRKLLNGDTGETVVGVVGIMLLLMSLSGTILWLPRTINRRTLKRAFSVNRAGWRRMNFDLHKVVGVIAFAFLLTSGATGAYMVFHDALDPLVNTVTRSTPRPRPPASESGKGSLPTLDEILARARIALPDAEMTFITLPAKPGAAITVRARVPGEMHPNGRSIVYFDAANGNLLRTDNALNAPLGTRITNFINPLHTGRVGGIVTRLLLVLTGLVPAFLFMSGVVMWWNRVVARGKWMRGRQVFSSGMTTQVGATSNDEAWVEATSGGAPAPLAQQRGGA